MTKVSVIVPVYNVEKYIDRCIKSLINQSFKDYEIVIVNDGSRDNSQKIIDKYVKKYPEKIVSYIKENGGVSSARNYGINNARGKYLTFVDSDDYVSKDYLKLLYDKITENDNDMVFSDVYKKKNDVTEVMMGLRSENIDIHKNALISLPATWNKMYKKSLFTNNNIIYPEEIRLGEDLATITKLILHAKNIGYVNTPIYYYIIREGSATNQKDFNSKFLDIFKVFLK